MAKKKVKPKKKAKKSFKKPSLKLTRKQKVLWGSFFMLLGIGLCIAFVSFLFNWKVDQSTLNHFGDRTLQADNWLSKFGAEVSNFFIYKGFGLAAFSFAILTVLSGVYLFFGFKLKGLLSFWFWGLILMIWFAVFFGFFAHKNALLGGIIGYEINDFLQDYLGFAGTILVMIFVFIAYFVIRFNVTPELFVKYFKRTRKEVTQEFEKSAETKTADRISSEEKSQPTSTATTAASEQKQVNGSEPVVEPKPPEKIVIKSKDDEDEMDMEVETAAEEEEVENLSNKLVEDFGEFEVGS